MSARSWLVARVLTAAVALPCVASGQGYPDRPITLIVSVGGGVGISARLIGQGMSDTLGQPVVVEVRAGATGFIAARAVASAPPDGYTLFVTTSSTLAIGPHLRKNVPFDPLKDFTPITLAYAGMAMVVVHEDVPAKSLGELIDYAKRNPRKVTFASNGIGSNFHLIGEQLKRSAGVDMVHVPYKGTGDWFLDVVSGRVLLGFPSLDNFRPFLGSGKVRVIAVAEANRHPQLPDVPTVAETVPGFEKPPSWIGLFAPAGLPGPLLARLNEVAVATIKSPRVLDKLVPGGYLVIANRPEEARAIVNGDYERAGRLVKAAGIAPQ